MNLIKPSCYCTYCQVEYSKIQHGAHIAFMCFVWVSEQTATFALHDTDRLDLYSRGGECLLRGTDLILIKT